MPIIEPSTNLIILSDLHLSTGAYLPSGSPDPLEQFVADQAFVQFSEHLIGHLNQESQPRRLLFLGDFLDFLHARAQLLPEKHVLDIDTSEAIAHQKLERIFAGHPAFFEALGRIAAEGFHVDLVPGNHDIDLMRPAIQSHFTDLLVKAGRQADIATRVHFFPWLYVIPGLLYAEHGNQHHDINSFPTLLAPWHHRHPDALELPLGSYFDTYIHHLVKMPGTSNQMIQSPIRYQAGKLIRHPAELIQAAPDLFRFTWKAIQVVAYRASPGCAAKQKAYRAGLLTEYAAQLDLGVNTVVLLDKLCAAPNIQMLLRLLKGVLSPASQTIQSGYLFRAAQTIHRLLQSKGRSVPFYVFGHSHQASNIPLPAGDGAAASFLNSGTWSETSFSGKERTRDTFPFIHIIKEPNSPSSTARLLIWNENLKRIEPFM